MTALDALLQAILANPADDAVRLVYADALEEAGQAQRAEFIQVQVALAKGRKCGRTEESVVENGRCERCIYCDRFEALRRRERELLGNSHWLAWAAPVQALVGNKPIADILQSPWRFQRGFVAIVRCHLADWLQHGSAIVALQPVEQVETEKQPAISIDQESYYWSGLASARNQPHWLAHDLFDLLDVSDGMLIELHAYYRSKAAALSALSLILLRHAGARYLIGLDDTSLYAGLEE